VGKIAINMKRWKQSDKTCYILSNFSSPEWPEGLAILNSEHNLDLTHIEYLPVLIKLFNDFFEEVQFDFRDLQHPNTKIPV
jgi:hypothetical protein